MYQNTGPMPKARPIVDAVSLLTVLIGRRVDWIAVRRVGADGRKFYLPSPMDDHALVIGQHLDGRFRSRACRIQDEHSGHRLAERTPLGFGAYCLRRRGSRFTCGWIALDIDVAGEGHAGGLVSAQEAMLLAIDIAAVLESEGLRPIIERSQGGRGAHVWVIFDTEVPAEFAYFLAQRYRSAAKQLRPGPYEIEAFPKQPAADRWPGGSLVALPLIGRAQHPEGGQLLWADGSKRDPATAAVTRIPDRLLQEWRKAEAVAQAREAYALDQRRRDAALAQLRGFEAFSLTCDEVLEAIAPEALTRRAGSTLLCACPRHESRSGESLHIDLQKDCWYCFSCSQGGRSFLLARWFLGDQATMRDVIEACLEKENA